MTSPEPAAAEKPVEPAPARKPNPIRRLYDWVIGWAKTPYGVPALFVLAFAESSFFPIPPDVLLIALALSLPKKALRFAAWATVASVAGGVLGYYIGYGLWQVVLPYVMHVPGFTPERIDKVMGLYREWDVVAVFVAAFTPIPYKVFTVTAGISSLNLPAFVGASLVGRGGRFFLVAVIIRLLGDRARVFIEKYFNLLTIAGTLLLVGGFVALRLLR